MKSKILKNLSAKLLIAVAVVSVISACNKDLADAIPINYPVATTSIGEYMATDTNFRLFRIASNKVGMFANLSDRTKSYTVYAPTNAAFRAIGFDSLQIVTATGANLTAIGGIVNFHIIPGEVWKSAAIPTTFPNVQLPTTISLGTLPGTIVPFPMTTFLSKRGSDFWYNNVPGLPTSIEFTYGSLNQISRVSLPPSVMVKNLIDADANLSLFDSLLVKADSGQTTSAIIPVMLNPGASMTVFAPNNTAVKTLIAQMTGGLVPPTAPDAVHAAFIRTNVPQATAQGLVVYHILAAQNTLGAYVPQRVFSVNFTTTPTFYKTLVNSSVGIHPGVSVTAFFTGQNVDSLKVIGVGAGSALATSKPASNFDRFAVNGLVHVIDQVLRPQ